MNKHYDALASLHVDADANGQRMYRALRRLEARAGRAAEDACNTPRGSEAWPRIRDQVVRGVRHVFGGTLPPGFFVNADPRGYALKIDNEEVTIPAGMATDWGGHGCLAWERSGPIAEDGFCQ